MNRRTDLNELAEAVRQLVASIPPGRATSYGAIARAAGFAGYARHVGHLLARETTPGLPAHRVVNSRGALSGAAGFGAPDRMRRLLESEGIEIADGRIRHWKEVFWDPVEEIGFRRDETLSGAFPSSAAGRPIR